MKRNMKILYLNEVTSTHFYLIDYIKKNKYREPLAVITDIQTNGIGSRNNSWYGEQGNLFLSFVIHKNELPFDLPIQSASIYFSYILKDILTLNNSSIWLKWPNDFYIKDKKIGGTITKMIGDLIYCGIGINLKNINSMLDKRINQKCSLI